MPDLVSLANSSEVHVRILRCSAAFGISERKYTLCEAACSVVFAVLQYRGHQVGTHYLNRSVTQIRRDNFNTE